MAKKSEPKPEPEVKVVEKTNKERRQAAMEILKNNSELTAPQIAILMNGQGFNIDPQSKNFSVFISNQRKKLSGDKTNSRPVSSVKTLTDFDQFKLARELVGIVGSVEKTADILKTLSKYDIGQASKCVDRWKKIVENVGEENAIKFIDAMM